MVGGGPAGSSCARALHACGLAVVVLDRRSFPRDKICAGWVTPQVFASLAVDLADYARGRTLQPIRGFRTRRTGQREARAGGTEVISYAIRRDEFDHYLLERAGARLRLGEPLRSLERSGGRWIANGALAAHVVVGAGGHFCPVARQLGGSAKVAEPIVAAQEIEFALTDAEAARCPVDPDVPELFFEPDLKGYGWLVRKGRFLNVGLGRQDTARLSDRVGAFLRFLHAEGRLPFDPPAGMHGHAYLLHGQAPRALGPAPGVLLVGDAAGLAYPQSGEGIRPAVEAGLLAARCIAALGGRADTELASAYVRAIEARFGPRRRRVPFGVTDLLPARVVRPLAGALFAAPWFARRVVVDRWFTHRGLPALAPEASTPAPRRSAWLSSQSSPLSR